MLPFMADGLLLAVTNGSAVVAKRELETIV
jgi:hypothetical protein